MLGQRRVNFFIIKMSNNRASIVILFIPSLLMFLSIFVPLSRVWLFHTSILDYYVAMSVSYHVLASRRSYHMYWFSSLEMFISFPASASMRRHHIHLWLTRNALSFHVPASRRGYPIHLLQFTRSVPLIPYAYIKAWLSQTLTLVH